MKNPKLQKVFVKIYEYGTKNVADVTIRLVDTKNLIGIYRSNPTTIELEPGSYAIYFSGDYYDTAMRAFNLIPDNNLTIELPIYPVGTMPPPPRSIREMPVRTEPLDVQKAVELLGLPIKKADIREDKYDGPAFVDYRNIDGYVYTTKMNVEEESVMAFDIGPVPVQLFAWCGNNSWREIGSPGKK